VKPSRVEEPASTQGRLLGKAQGADSLSQHDVRRGVGSLQVGVWTAAACPLS
jgi:hypothetical protein